MFIKNFLPARLEYSGWLSQEFSPGGLFRQPPDGRKSVTNFEKYSTNKGK
ncbi:MAG: hypothetical protein R6W78_04385 [Bacteroidales bacterium]